ncbi:MAG: class I SAM-dependent methyltransferase [Ilumatobacteraceae bacterium]
MDRPGTRLPPWFFERADERPDDEFYGPPRLVTHLDDAAIAEVGRLYRELALDGDVLDLMSSWISHFDPPPRRLTVLGMNAVELDANPAATGRVVQDLNVDPRLPFDDESFDAATCCVSVDYLTRPIEVIADVARVLRPGAPLVFTFSNRCFPTKAIRGWLASSEASRMEIVRAYFDASGSFGEVHAELRNPGRRGDPLWAVWATRP